MEGSALVLRQGRDGGLVRLDEQGGVLIQIGLDGRSAGEPRAGFSGLPVILEEIVSAQLASALAFAAWAMERVDPTQKLTRVVVAARIHGVDHLAWRTRAEHAVSPNSLSINMVGGARSPVQVSAIARRCARSNPPRRGSPCPAPPAGEGSMILGGTTSNARRRVQRSVSGGNSTSQVTRRRSRLA